MITKASLQDIPAVAELAALLWPHHTAQELVPDLEQAVSRSDNALFLCHADDIPVAFAHSALRHDYVEGTDSSPVGYLEGIFVREEYRRRGFSKALLASCEAWAKDMGCSEFASDCELTNEASIVFHTKLGFTEANRIVCFQKKL